jgi:dihydroflavonol-4-reductase
MGESLMKVLIVGGTGQVGGYTALYFQELGHDVTIMSRSKPKGASRLGELPFVAGNYVEERFDDGRLEGYDWLVFGAGSDMGDYDPSAGMTEAEFFERANIDALPRFFEAARRAGIRRTAYMGSFYSFVSPQVMDSIPYVKSRHVSDEAVRALSAPGFNVCSCALPWTFGLVPGLNAPHWHALTRYALGEFPDIPYFAPPGGANFMSSRSLAQALLGGLERGESGKAYLVGDVNMSWKDFFEMWFKAAGRPRELEVRTGHPIIPDYVLSYLEHGGTDYEPPADETALLGYERRLVPAEVENCVRYYSKVPIAEPA